MTIKFYSTKTAYGCFSNFKKSPIFIYGRWWKNVEAAYQAQKTSDEKEIAQIWLAKTPMEARLIGQKVTMRPDWDDVKVKVMKECVVAKFTQNHDMREELLSTNDEHLIEDSLVDSFWGCGADGKGQNYLGRVLMEVRKELCLGLSLVL